jgi:hypothetical protein
MAANDHLYDPNAEKRQDIFRRIAQAPPGTKTVAVGKALALTDDNRVVDADDPEASYVLAGEYGALPADLAKELGVKAYKRSDEEEAAAQARLNAARGNYGPTASSVTTPASEVSAPPTDLVGGTIAFGGQPAPAAEPATAADEAPVSPAPEPAVEPAPAA